jgi:hypothetical protein
MQKLKKSIKSNLLKSCIKDSYFILTNPSAKKLTVKTEVLYITKNLTKSTINRLGLNNLVDNAILKFPLELTVFQTLNDLKISLNQDREKLKNSSPILVKTNNLFLKDKNYELLINQNPRAQIVKFRRLIYSVVNLVFLLKLRIKLKLF